MMVMKRIILVSALAVAALFAVSCERERVPQPGNGGNNNGSGGGTLPSEVTYTYNNIPSADLVYVSTSYSGVKALFDVYDLVLCSAGVTYDDNYNFTGKGAALVAEVNTYTNEGKIIRLADGKYPVSANIKTDVPCTYIGEEENEVMYPSYIYYCPDGSSEGAYYLVTDGSLNVSQNSDGSYNLNGTFLTEKAQFVFNYNGTPELFYVPAYNKPPQRGNQGDRSTYEIKEIKNYNAGVQIFYGAPYDIKKSGYSKWDVQLFEKDSQKDDAWLKIELCTEELTSGVKLPAGDYLCRTPDVFNENTLVPFSLVPGDYGDENDEYYATWFFDSNNPYDEYGRYYSYVLTDGSVKASLEGETYTFDYELFDDRDGYIVKGKSVVEDLKYYDETKAKSVSTSRTARSGKSLRPSSVMRNFVARGSKEVHRHPERASCSAAARAL